MNEDIGYLKREIAALKSQLQNIESRSRQSWVYAGGGNAVKTIYRIKIYGGNTLITVGGTTIKGIKYIGAGISSLPVEVPVDGSTYADCLGYGKIDDAGSMVWICNGTLVQTPTDATSETGGVVSKDQWCWSYYAGYLIFNGSQIPVYILWR